MSKYRVFGGKYITINTVNTINTDDQGEKLRRMWMSVRPHDRKRQLKNMALPLFATLVWTVRYDKKQNYLKKKEGNGKFLRKNRCPKKKAELTL